MADRFSQLPDHLLDYLLRFITNGSDLDDLLRFSCVCQRWRSFVSPLLPPKRLPWLIVPYGGHFSKTGTIWNQTLGFYSFHSRKLYKVETPQITNRRICGSCQGGWLITLHENGEIQVLHPFSKSVIHLPPVTKLPGDVGDAVVKENRLIYFVPRRSGKMKVITSSEMREFYIFKAIMSSTSPTTGIVMVIHGVSRKLAFCRPGRDNKWISVEGDCEFEDIVFYKGDCYAVKDTRDVFVVSGLETSQPFVKLVRHEKERHVYLKKHLVEIKGELFLLSRIRYELEPEDIEARLTVGFTYHRVDFNEGKLVWDEDIDEECAVFVGCNASFTVSASEVRGCKGNHIYFTDDCLDGFVSQRLENYVEESFGGHDIGIYSSKEDDCDRIYPCDSKLIKPPPVWFTTSLH